MSTIKRKNSNSWRGQAKVTCPPCRHRQAVASALQYATRLLRSQGIDSARLDTELLLAHVLKTSRAKLYAALNEPLTVRQLRNFQNLVQKRIRCYPVAYLLGAAEFYSLRLFVNKAMLIPRPETELLVEKALELMGTRPCVVADIGTGSGAIAVALAVNAPSAQIHATDISLPALKVARQNAKAHRVASRISFHDGSLLRPLARQKGQFDLIVSNPPYVARADYRTLDPELHREPKIALLAGQKGIEFHQRIVREADDYLKAGGKILLEVGMHQAEPLRKWVHHVPHIRFVESYRDLQGIERVMLFECR